MRNRVSICTLIIGLICLFTQVARGQQSNPAASGSDDRRGTPKKPGAPAEPEVVTANNPIAPNERHILSKVLCAHGLRCSGVE
jgi:hypothetical protein